MVNFCIRLKNDKVLANACYVVFTNRGGVFDTAFRAKHTFDITTTPRWSSVPPNM